tara:strand:+ start:25511 stop:26044 length:534 start_codon:yes stop_codon:yes gene_type:complete
MKSLAEQMSFYHGYHTKKATIYTHFVGIPLVMFSLMIVLSWVKIYVPGVYATSLMWLALALLCLYYVALDIVIGVAMIIALGLLGWLAEFLTRHGPSATNAWIFAGCFIAGWVIQFIGHFFEGRRPALFDNLFQALIGPMFVVAEIFFMCGYKQKLKNKMLKFAEQRARVNDIKFTD